ncbi:MAG TPA: transcription elongation factor GreA [Candidatus Polarisedimenticolaceae bacterium]|nr:transcription elongation factor GreA [Candidatus Polarisedimenticolaceae bacterium]
MREIKEKLEAELKTLEHELRIELPREIKTALAMGDLRENAEYHSALERQAYVKARIGQLRERLGELGMMNLDQLPHDRVGLGSSVTLLDLDSEEEVRYDLVVPELADLAKGLISVASPVGRGLLGRRPGDEVEVQIPAGKKRFELLALRTLHDKNVG